MLGDHNPPDLYWQLSGKIFSFRSTRQPDPTVSETHLSRWTLIKRRMDTFGTSPRILLHITEISHARCLYLLIKHPRPRVNIKFRSLQRGPFLLQNDVNLSQCCRSIERVLLWSGGTSSSERRWHLFQSSLQPTNMLMNKLMPSISFNSWVILTK